MISLEKINALDVTEEVGILRDRNGIGNGDKVALGELVYSVHTPRVLIFTEKDYQDRYAAGRFFDPSSTRRTVASGNTQVSVYEEIKRQAESDPAKAALLRGMQFYALDEVRPVTDVNENESYRQYYMDRLIRPNRLDPEQLVIFDGRADDPYKQVEEIDNRLCDKSRGIALLGIGPDEFTALDGTFYPSSPHIAFVGRGVLPNKRSHVTDFDGTTRYVNSCGEPDRHFLFENAMTQGPENIIFETGERYALAKGPGKGRNVFRGLTELPNLGNPITYLSLEEGTTFLLDPAAARILIDNIRTLPTKTIYQAVKV